MKIGTKKARTSALPASLLLTAFLLAGCAAASELGERAVDRIARGAEERAEDRVDRTVDEALDQTEDAVVCVVSLVGSAVGRGLELAA